MSFITNFLDITEKLRPKIIRILKLIQIVEQKAKDIDAYLKNMRAEYLKDLKYKNEDNKEKLYEDKTYYKELLNLSDYKQNLIADLNYIIQNKFIANINKIIEEGEKECPKELNKVQKNLEKNEENFLNKKTKRNNQKPINKDDSKIFEEILYNEEDDDQAYCICKTKSKGRMIMCDNCQNWFHFKCMGLDENSNPNEFYCNACSEDNKENKENNNSSNNSNNNNKKTKKERNYKKKKV